MAKKKPNIIKETPGDIMEDHFFHNAILNHVKTFGFYHVAENIVEAYREEARRFNKHANLIEKNFKPKG